MDPLIDSLSSLFTNPLVLLSIGVPTFIAVYQFWDARRKAPVERRLMDAETKEAKASTAAAQALEASNIAQAVNLMIGLIHDMRTEIRRDLSEGAERQAVQTKRWVDEVVEQLRLIDTRVLSNTSSQSVSSSAIIELESKLLVLDTLIKVVQAEVRSLYTKLEVKDLLDRRGDA